MALDIIKKLFFTLCFSIILFASSSSIYLARSNYYITNGLIEEAKCNLIPNSNLYACDLTISYIVEGNSVTNQLIINSTKPYKKADNIGIEYDLNNYLNISLQTEYKRLALLTGLSGFIFLLTAIIFYNEIKKDISELLSYIPSFT